mgnify:CR=1 FL=1|jgi:uncharacterized protein YneF (UPF0154 family)
MELIIKLLVITAGTFLGQWIARKVDKIIREATGNDK